MGFYTDYYYRIELKEDVPDDVRNILSYLVNMGDDEEKPPLPSHKFFSTERWELLGSSHYGFSPSTFIEDWTPQTLNFQGEIKDYDEELRLFIDWIKPYSEEVVGYTKQEDREPQLVFYNSPMIYSRYF